MTQETQNHLEDDRAHVWHPFTQAQTAEPPIAVVSGKGASLFTADGREILDLISSWWVNIHGHAHPKIAQAIAEQAARLEQVIFADFTHTPAIDLAKGLSAVLPAGLSRIFFSDNGSTSVEIALKIAWQYWINSGFPERRRYLALEGAYHGDTFGAMSAGASSGFYDPFRPLLFEVDTIPFPETWLNDPDVEAKEAASLAALASLQLSLSPETAKAWQRIEAKHREGLARLAEIPTLRQFRVQGTIAACNIDLPETAYGTAASLALKKNFLARGLLIRPMGPVLYILPPYCISDAELDRAYTAIAEVVTTVSAV